MNAPSKLSKIDQIVVRDGDRCWLCHGKLDFQLPANSKKAPTKEHLVPISLGGTNDVTNLVLCHKSCNAQLGNRPRAEKEAIRAKWVANREKMALARNQAVVTAKAKAIAGKPTQTSGGTQSAMSMGAIAYWQKLAVGAAGTALLAIGFSLGLLVS